MKKKNERKIIKEINKQLAGQRIEGTAELNFKWYEPNRKRDLDNVCFAKKFILDALVKQGIIESDGWRGVKGFTDSFFVDAKNPRIEVEIIGSKNENIKTISKSEKDHGDNAGSKRQRRTSYSLS